MIDYDRLHLHAPQVAYDLPAGGRRLIQRADGYDVTMVAGQITYRERRGDRRPARPPGARRAPSAAVGCAMLELTHCEWTADDMRDPALWTELLTPPELDEIDAALRVAQAKSDDLLEIGAADFPLPRVRARLERIERELVDGRGVVRLRGIDRARYDNDEMCLIYWGIGAHLGKPWAQNAQGPRARRRHRPGQGARRSDRARQRARRRARCRSTATARTSSASCASIPARRTASRASRTRSSLHNKLVRERPELAAALYEPLPYDFRGEESTGSKPFYFVPVFTEWDDRLFVRLIPPYILASQRHAEAPRLTRDAAGGARPG